MSDLMLLAVLRMPFHTQDDLHLIQLQERCLQAADRIESDAETIAALRSELADLRQWKADVEAAHRQVMDERCPSDEQHCTCVPILRREIADLRESKDFWYKSWILEENMLKEAEKIMAKQEKQLARYREGFGPILSAHRAVNGWTEAFVSEEHKFMKDAINEAVRLLDDSSKVTKSVAKEG